MRENSIWKGEKFARVDLLSQLSTNKLLTEIQFDEIYHFAGNSSVIDSWRDPLNALIDNSKLTSNLVNAINTYSAETKLIFISSSAVYARKIGPIKELDPLGPDSPYGMSKLISELEVESVKNSLVIRPFFVIGSGKKNDLLFDWIGQIRSFKNDKKNFLEVGDLDVIRDFISVEASTDAIMQLGSSQTGIYNLGSGLSTSLIEVIDILRAISGIDFELMQNAPIKRRRGDRKEVVADVTKLNGVYKFDTQPTLTEQISLIYNSYSD
jgi:nucleoside-diphosphate-sugar epimerase